MSSRDRITAILCAALATTIAMPAQQSDSNKTVSAGAQTVSGVTPAITPVAVTTTGGTAGLMPVWTGTSTIGNSIVYQTSNGIGIGRFPNATLDIGGTSTFRGSMGVSRAGDATTAAGAKSFPILMQSSVYNTAQGKNVLPYFQIQTEPALNNTASAGATLNFLYYSGVGATPNESGLYINGDGNIHFAPTQTFPITQGPQGPVGSQGPIGPQGPTGPQGPSGASLSFPYFGSATVNGNYMLTLTNNGDGGGGYFTATTIGDGVSAFGGTSGTTTFSAGGAGVTGVGGFGAGANNYGGAGGNFTGGDSQSGGFRAGDGLDVTGGSAYNAGNGGYAIYAAGGVNANYAAYFDGNVHVNGTLSKAGGSFRIDHPDDPANKYLSHSFVESPDMMNIYNGNVVTDATGTVIVTMPSYFESLNRDFRYQLTIMGHQFAQALVDSEIANGSFTIKTDKPNIKVSWQVTGVRQDAWANAHRIPVEEEKLEADRGKFLHPELFGRPNDASIEESHRINLPRQKNVLPTNKTVQ